MKLGIALIIISVGLTIFGMSMIGGNKSLFYFLIGLLLVESYYAIKKLCSKENKKPLEKDMDEEERKRKERVLNAFKRL